MVKQYPDGKASTYLHSMAPGEPLYFIKPLFGGYRWTPNQYPHVMLIAGGAGITPVYQLAQGILNNPEDKTKITLVFGVNSDADVLLRKEFEKFEQKFPGRFKAVYTVSNPSEGSPFRKGYVTKALLEEVSEEAQMEDTKVFVCGPPAMEKALLGGRGPLKGSGVLEQLGYKKEQMHNF
jgi:cytochrome-b5 reductase